MSNFFSNYIKILIYQFNWYYNQKYLNKWSHTNKNNIIHQKNIRIQGTNIVINLLYEFLLKKTYYTNLI